MIKLNLGCSDRTPDGWINVDYALGARFLKNPFLRALNRKVPVFRQQWDKDIFIHDLRKRFPWPDDSADIIYSSHTLEHFPRIDGRSLLFNCYRVLKKGGIIRIVVPDLSYIVNCYTSGKISADAFVESLNVLYKRDRGRIKNALAPFRQFPHQCMYDQASLLRIMREVGFTVQDRAPFDSAIPDINEIELENRCRDAVIIEGTK